MTQNQDYACVRFSPLRDPAKLIWGNSLKRDAGSPRT
jgi:hypothetical protein